MNVSVLFAMVSLPRPWRSGLRSGSGGPGPSGPKHLDLIGI